MSLSITINNINDLTDTERAVLRLVVGDKQVALTGPTATQQFIERLSAFDGDEPAAPVLAVTAPTAPIDLSKVQPPVPASAELDSAGLPWDKRIHSSSRAKVADGTWRKLRGVDDALVASVEAELRAVQAIPAPTLHHHAPLPADTPAVVVLTSEQHAAAHAPATVPAPPAPTAALAEMQAKLAAAENPVPAPPAPATSAPLPVDLDAAGQPAMTFADLMRHVTPMLVAGKLPQDKLLAITAEFGLPHLAALGARPDLVEAVKARIDAEVGNGAA